MVSIYFRRHTYCFLLHLFFFVLGCSANEKFYHNPNNISYIDRMMDYNLVETPIKNYLKCQGQIIDRLSRRDTKAYNTVLEFGCYNGYNVRFLQNEQINYVGVDVNYASFKKKFSATAFRKNAIHIVSSAINFLKLPIPTNTLIIFPFNLFGNMKEQDQLYCLKKMASYKVDFVIFSYVISKKSNLVRSHYYQKIFQKKISHKETKSCSCFEHRIDAKTNFISNAYTDQYWEKKFDADLKKNYQITVGTFSEKVGLYRFYQNKREQMRNRFVKQVSLFDILKQSPCSLSNL